MIKLKDFLKTVEMSEEVRIWYDEINYEANEEPEFEGFVCDVPWTMVDREIVLDDGIHTWYDKNRNRVFISINTREEEIKYD